MVLSLLSLLISMTLMLLLTTMLLTGGGVFTSGSIVEHVEEKPAAPPKVPPAPGGPEDKAPLSKVGMKRVMDRPRVENDMHEIGRLYVYYSTDPSVRNRAGRIRVSFMDWLRDDRGTRHLYKAVVEEVYVLVPRAQARPGVIVAYEKAADAADQHIVAYGDDGHVAWLTTPELQAALAEQGNPMIEQGNP
jgi:hypothetical protein